MFTEVYHIDVKTPFQLVFLPNACEVFVINSYIPSTVALTNSNPTLTLNKRF